MGVEHSVQAFEAMDSRLTLYSVLRGSGRGMKLTVKLTFDDLTVN